VSFLPNAIPRAVWTGALDIFGITLHVSVLDNGQRVFHADDVEALFEAMGDVEVTDADMRRLAEFIKGASH
jgi:hypothetical protein